jgi:hypothetical protein
LEGLDPEEDLTGSRNAASAIEGADDSPLPEGAVDVLEEVARQ